MVTHQHILPSAVCFELHRGLVSNARPKLSNYHGARSSLGQRMHPCYKSKFQGAEQMPRACEPYADLRIIKPFFFILQLDGGGCPDYALTICYIKYRFARC